MAQRLGSVHVETLSYLLGWPLVAGEPNFPQNYTKQDISVCEISLHFLTNFIKTGDPNELKGDAFSDYGQNRERNRFKGLIWEPYEVQSQQYLTINVKPKMKNHYRGHKMAVWLNLIPQLHQRGDEEVSMRHHHFHERGDVYDGVLVPEHPGHVATPYLPPGPRVTTATLQECPPNQTASLSDEEDDQDDANGILERLADSGYHSYATALGVTVGVGCILLLLNILIFAGIYYQREKSRKKGRLRCRETSSLSHSDSGTELGDCSRGAHVIKLHEPPPYYNTTNKCEPRAHSSHKTSSLTRNKVPPQPPRRTTSTATIKKRVQIQEISV